MSTTGTSEAQPEAATPWIIDGDGHVTEPDAMWDRLPERYRGLAPRLSVTSEESPAAPGPDGTPYRRREQAAAAIDHMYSIEGGLTASRRLPDMDVDLIEKAVLYPTLGLLTGNVRDPQASMALHQVTNDWMAEYCSYDRSRLFGVGALPSTNGEDALAEARRCVEELQFCGVFQRPPLLPGTLPVHDQAFEPLWDYLESSGVPIVFHSGAPPAYYTERYPDFIALHAIHHVTEAMMALTSFILYGVLERHPGLRLGLVESGALWAWALCHRLDEHIENATESATMHYALPANVKLTMSASEYFRRQCFVSVEEAEPGLAQMLESFPENVLFASDYPHPDAAVPGTTAALLNTKRISPEQRRAVLRDNAAHWYKL